MYKKLLYWHNTSKLNPKLQLITIHRLYYQYIHSFKRKICTFNDKNKLYILVLLYFVCEDYTINNLFLMSVIC